MGNTFPEFVPELLLHGAEQLPVVAVLEASVQRSSGLVDVLSS